MLEQEPYPVAGIAMSYVDENSKFLRKLADVDVSSLFSWPYVFLCHTPDTDLTLL